MAPQVDTQFELQFALGASAWWLLVLVPAIGVAGWALYRKQWKGLERVHIGGLVALRLLLLASLVFLAFRPSLVYRTVLTYAGRVLLVVDDSESMRTRCEDLSDAAACRLARAVALSDADRSDAYQRLADMVVGIEARVRDYERILKKMAADDTARWDLAAETQDRLMERFDGFAAAVAAASAPPEAMRPRLAEATRSVTALSRSLQTLFSASAPPDAAAFDSFCATLESDAATLVEVQAAVDAAALASGDEDLAVAARAVRSRSRLDVIATLLEERRDAIMSRLGGQSVEVVRLITGDRTVLGTFDADTVAPEPGATEITDRLGRLLNEDSDFPLTAVALFTDGRDLGGDFREQLAQEYSRAQVPVYAAGIGGLSEPTDLSILRIAAPPFAVVDAPMNVRLQVKTSLARPQNVVVEIMRGAEKVVSQEVSLGAWETESLTLRLAPRESGHVRYAIRLGSVDGEAFPVANNSAEFVTHVRPERVRVLMLDWKPRWETRFALNTLRRLDYIDLNALIVVVQENGEVERGVQRGAWPSTPDELSVYDLVILGETPEGLLSASDWEALRQFAEDGGKTLCLLGETAGLPGLADARACPPDGAATAIFRKLAPADAAPSLARLTPAGATHPVTRLFAPRLGASPVEAGEWAYPETHALMTAAETGRPLIAARFVGAGKVISIRSDQLWKIFNPSHLEAHAQLYVNLIEWAIDGGPNRADGASAGRAIALETRSLTTRNPCQVWITGDTDTNGGQRVDAVAGGAVVASAPATATREGAGIVRASFDALPAGDVSFRLSGDETTLTGPVLVVDDYPELRVLARDDDYLRRLAEDTGGAYREVSDFERFFLGLDLKERVRKHESTWRLWDSALVWCLLAATLTAEWVWRKLVGLV